MPTPTCQKTRRDISERLDGAPSLPAGAQTHIDNCGDCSRFYDDARALAAQLSRPVAAPAVAAPEIPLPAGFHDRVMTAVCEAKPERKTVAFPRWLLPVSGAAAAAVIALLAWPAGSPDEIAKPGPTPAPPSPPAKLPTSFEAPIDVPALTAAAGQRVEAAFGKEADAIASDIGKVRDFFSSRMGVASHLGL